MAKSIETYTPETLVLFPGGLGDFICVLPALEVLQATLQTQGMTIVVRGQSLELALRIPWISRVLSLDRKIFAALFSSPTMVSPESRQLFSTIQRVVSWFGHTSPEMRATLEQLVPERVQSFAFFNGQEQLHACQYYLRCLGSSEIRCPSLTLGDEDKKWLDAYWRHHGWQSSTRLLVIHPGSGGKRKRWAAEGFVQVAQWWKKQGNGEVIIILGPAEECEEEIWRRVGFVENALPLWQVAALLSSADGYVGNDSGVSHVAGAVGARGVVLFGPTCPEQWRPLGGALTVLINRNFRNATSDSIGISLQEVPPESVVAVLAHVCGIR